MTWTELQKSASSEDSIRYWGAYRGYTHGTFVLVEVNDSFVKFTIPSGEHLKVHRRDFEKIAPLYDEYVSGSIASTEIKRQTGRSAYIFSLVHEIRERGMRKASGTALALTDV